jgi:hypothetical protein
MREWQGTTHGHQSTTNNNKRYTNKESGLIVQNMPHETHAGMIMMLLMMIMMLMRMISALCNLMCYAKMDCLAEPDMLLNKRSNVPWGK